MKEIKPVLKKLLKRCLPTLKAKKPSVPLTATATTTCPMTAPLEATCITPTLVHMPTARLPPQAFAQFFSDFNSATTEAGPLGRHVVEDVRKLARELETIHTGWRRQGGSAEEAAQECEASVTMFQQNLELKQKLARMAKELEEEIRVNHLNQEMIETQGSIIWELEETAKQTGSDVNVEQARRAAFIAETAKESTMLKRTIEAKDGEIERLRAALAQRDEDHRSQIEAKEYNELKEKATATGIATKTIIDLKNKLREKIVAKRAVDARLAEAITERSAVKAKCEKQVEAAQTERDRISELCRKLEHKVASLLDTLSVYDNRDEWLKCFESDIGRDMLPGHALDHIPFARFLTPIKCTSWENPGAMRLSELGPLIFRPSNGAPRPITNFNRFSNASVSSPTPETRARKSMRTQRAQRSQARELTDSPVPDFDAVVVRSLPSWTLPLPLRGPELGEVEL